ncbi:uncharacterized protein [Apostichopus japonicus]|uniref:uncharacterized protein isoform X2 n=1 Tax=Stichopus japonicus TaxID=307972 RepID=UPI003AB71C83
MTKQESRSFILQLNDMNVEMISRFVLIFLMLHQASGCMSPQYAELGETGLIHCNFLSDRNALYWRGDITSSSSSLLVSMVNDQKGGKGYESGEYDMLPNGSLVIKRVTILHEKTYEAIIIDKTDNSYNYYVNLTVTVTPATKIPIIKDCLQEELCLADNHVDFLQCEVGGARPPAKLKWFYVSSDGREVEYNSTHDVIQEEKHTFRSNSNISLTSNEMGNGKLVSLYLCRATFPPSSLSYERVVILDQSRTHWPSLAEPEMVYFQINLPAILTCQRREIGASYIWKKVTLKGTSETVAYRSPSHDSPINIGIYSVNEFGELVIASVSTETEGNYTCASSNSNRKLEIYELIVVVPPSASPNIGIDACRQTGENECTVTSHGSGELRCSVSDVRPVISVEWSEDDDSNSKLEVFSSTLIVEEHSGLYTVTQLLEYSIAENTECNEEFPLKCIATGPATKFFDLKVARVTLLNRKTHCPRPVSPEPTSSSLVWIPITVVIVIVLIAVSGLILVKYRCRNDNDNSLDHEDQEQGEELLQTQEKQSKKSDLTKKRNQLLHDLEVTYRSQLDDSKVHVMNTFSKLNPKKSSADDERYVKLGSYTDIFGQEFMQKQRLVLEGEAGCGKSTFAMTIAREWLNEQDESPMRDVGMLIILSLIDFDENTTIPEAIKKQIVPDDRQEEFSTQEIEQILHNENKLVIILDGFDEFVERNNRENNNSYMYRLIRNRVLNQAFIIILTRSVSYLRVFGEKLFPIVKLHSFTNPQVQSYIRNSFSKQSDFEYLKKKIDSNDNLKSLCEIPLFLEMVTTMYQADNSFSLSASKQTLFFKELIDKKYAKSEENDSSGYIPSDNVSTFAFDAICKSKSSWLMNEICENFGNELDTLISLNFFKKVSKSTQSDNCTNEQSIIQSTHNIYQYYLGAHFLSCVDTPERLLQYLQEIDVLTCQHLLIFTCGLNAKCIIPIVRYLLDKEDIFPFPLRDCITQCLTESDLEVNDEVENLLKKLSMKEHGIAILNTDNKPLKTAKASLLNMCNRSKITVQFLRLVNLQLSIDLQKLGLVDKEANLYYQLPMVKTLILTDFAHTITDDFILSIVKNIPTVTEIAVFSTNRPLKVDEESKKILIKRRKELLVSWVHYKELKKKGEVREVELLYPSRNFQRWLSLEETLVVILMRKFKAFFGDVNEQEALRIMSDVGIEGFFKQVKLGPAMRIPYEKQSKEFLTMLRDILDLWQKIDDASRSQDVEYYTKKSEEQLEKLQPKLALHRKFFADNVVEEIDITLTDCRGGGWSKNKQQIFKKFKQVFFEIQI